MYYYFPKKMSKISIPLISIFLFTMCGKNTTNEPDEILVFKKENAVNLANSLFFSEKQIITLEFNESSLIHENAALKTHNDNVFVYSQNSIHPILRFDMQGNFINKIGNFGNGPNEYSEILDITIDKEKSLIELLSYNTIISYSFNGASINNKETHIPASSFTKINKTYWFYTGNNVVHSKYRLFQTDEKFNIINKYLTNKSNMLPINEYNFKQSAYYTFSETFYNSIYKLKNNSLSMPYHIEFPNLEFPNGVHEVPAMDVIEYLKNYNYATIKCYLENDTYIYVLVLENNIDSMPNFYHWIINKTNNQEMIIKTDFIYDSYLTSPQILTDDNHLLFLGYLNETNEDLVDYNTNPSIIVIDLKSALKEIK